MIDEINNTDIEVIGSITASDLKDLKFSGYRVTLTGAGWVPIKLLAQLLLKLDFTPTMIPEGEPSIAFEKPDE
jgi:hypothetical protein